MSFKYIYKILSIKKLNIKIFFNEYGNREQNINFKYECYFLNMKLFIIIFFGISSILKSVSFDSINDSIYFEFEPIIVTVDRFELNLIKSPFSVDKIINQNYEKNVSINDLINSSAGVFNQNENNFAQDLRVSIRGFGARSSFGIRGIKILVDGIPESTPDGQSQVDNIDMGFIEKIEIIKGLISSQYGNSSGGVISLTSNKIDDISFLETRYLIGSYGLNQFQIKTSKKFNKSNYLFSFSRNQGNGFREHSKFLSNIFNAKINWFISKKLKFLFLYNYSNSPIAQDPGALSIENINLNWKGARDKNLLFNSGEKVNQSKIGFLVEQKFNKTQIYKFKTYYISRSFNNRLPFQNGGQVEFSRNFFGLSNLLLLRKNLFGFSSNLSIGLDIESQIDLRNRYDNLNGIRGNKVFQQDEIFLNQAFFIDQKVNFSKKIDLILGARYDNNIIKAIDKYFDDGNSSGDIHLSNFSPKIAFVYSDNNQTLFSNIASNFETPTLNEFSNNPNLSGGFNQQLNPQFSRQIEFGVRTFKKNFLYNFSLFFIDIQNEFVPYEIDGLSGKTFYRNSGSSQRNGLELSCTFKFWKSLKFYNAYTFSDFKYKEFIIDDKNFRGNYTPGIPKHFLYSEISTENENKTNVKIIFRFSDKIYVNDSNANLSDSFQILDLRFFKELNINANKINLFFGINNLLNEKYFSNIRINAWGGRFFETAPLRNYYIGTEIKI